MDPSGTPGPSESVGRISASLIEALHLRLELFALELGEERERIVELVILSLVIALASFMVMLCLNIVLLVVFWDTHRIETAAGMVLFYALCGLGAWLLFRRRKRQHTPPFATSRKVLDEDREHLQQLGGPPHE